MARLYLPAAFFLLTFFFATFLRAAFFPVTFFFATGFFRDTFRFAVLRFIAMRETPVIIWFARLTAESKFTLTGTYRKLSAYGQK